MFVEKVSEGLQGGVQRDALGPQLEIGEGQRPSARSHRARWRRCAMRNARWAIAISWLSSLSRLPSADPGRDLLAQRDRDVERAGRARFLPGQHRGFVDRAGLDTAAGGLAAPFGGDRQRSFEEGADRAQARQDALAGGTGAGGGWHMTSIYTCHPPGKQNLGPGGDRILRPRSRRTRVFRGRPVGCTAEVRHPSVEAK